MFALKSRKGENEWMTPDEARTGHHRMVLPRPLRRMARLFSSLGAGRIDVPMHLGSVSVVAFFAATGLYAASINGETAAMAQSLTSAAGFAINKVKVSGNGETSEIDILDRLGLDGTTSLMALDVADTRAKLKTLPWVEDAEVRKIYPDTVEIKLTERDAFAIWQYGQELSLIEKDGSVIVPLRDNKFAHLPLFVGRDAKADAAAILKEFASWPDIRDQVKAFIRVSGRRWDLQLENGVLIKLPEHGIDRAMAELARFERENQVLERDILAVDFRLADRTTVQLTSAAAERREKAVQARAKELKKLAKENAI